MEPQYLALIGDHVLATDNKELKKQLSKAKEELNTIFLQKDDLLAYVIENGFHTADFLRQKAVLSIGERVISGKEDLKRRGMLETVERNIQERKRQEAKAAATQKFRMYCIPSSTTGWWNGEIPKRSEWECLSIRLSSKRPSWVSAIYCPQTRRCLSAFPILGRKGWRSTGTLFWRWCTCTVRRKDWQNRSLCFRTVSCSLVALRCVCRTHRWNISFRMLP